MIAVYNLEGTYFNMFKMTIAASTWSPTQKMKVERNFIDSKKLFDS